MKHIKRAAALVLAVVLSLCLAVTAFADNTVQSTGNLTVTGSGLYIPGEDAGKGKNVTAIRMFAARVTGDTTAAQQNEFDSYVLEKKWEDFFKQAEIFTAMKNASVIGSDVEATAITADELSNAAVAYLKTLTNDKSNKGTLADFAHKAQKWARDNNSTLSADPSLVTVKAAEQTSDVADKTKGTATFTGLTAGYYLVFPEGGSTGDNGRGNDAILVNVPKNGGVTEQTIKSTFPTVEKKVQTSKDGTFEDNGAAQVGDTVTFNLTAKVPDMTDYNTYKFVFHDTLSNGLAFDANSVKVTVAGAAVTKDTDYKVVEPSGASKELTVTFDNLKNVTGATTGAEIVVTYTAKITKDAVKDNPAKNTVYLEYSNNPGTDGTGKSNPDESKVYTYDIEIHKFHTEDIDANRLANATFKLTTDANGDNVVKLVNETVVNTYHVQGDGETGADTVTTDTTGKITIKGLKAGTYYLHETIAPTSYNKLKKPIKIEITVAGEAYTTPTYKVDEADQNTSNIIKVENVKGVMLPETGSIGTIGLTLLGVAVVLLGVFAPKKKKENR